MDINQNVRKIYSEVLSKKLRTYQICPQTSKNNFTDWYMKVNSPNRIAADFESRSVPPADSMSDKNIIEKFFVIKPIAIGCKIVEKPY